MNGVVGTANFVQVRVISDSAPRFYYILASLWRESGVDDTARRAALLRPGSFGPFDIGSEVPLRLNAQYRFIPICNGSIAWDNASTPNITSAQQVVALTC